LSNKIEKEELRCNVVEIRSVSEGEKLYLNGYAAKFNTLSEDLGGFRETIRMGAFSNAIKTDDVRALFNHDMNYVLGRNIAGTLELSEDATGLYFVVEVPNCQWARDLHESVKRGDINQCSFAFRVKLQDWSDKGDIVIRELIEVSLIDVSIVTRPAYLDTIAQARSMDEVMAEYKKTKEPEFDKVKMAKLKQENRRRLM
jgi:phage prohead protease, HK97 family